MTTKAEVEVLRRVMIASILLVGIAVIVFSIVLAYHAEDVNELRSIVTDAQHDTVLLDARTVMRREVPDNHPRRPAQSALYVDNVLEMVLDHLGMELEYTSPRKTRGEWRLVEEEEIPSVYSPCCDNLYDWRLQGLCWVNGSIYQWSPEMEEYLCGKEK